MQLAFVDTNCLILFIAGTVDPRLIPQVKRLETRNADHYDLLVRLIGQCEIAVTPHVISETSNFVRQTKRQPLGERLIDNLAALCRGQPEQHLPSAEAVDLDGYRRLGVTDATLLHLSRGHRLFTVDRVLWSEAMNRDIDAVNIDHYR